MVREPKVEAAIVLARRRALEGASLPLEALIAMAHQCFNTEYVFDETPAEASAIEARGGRLESDAELALYAAYRPLHALPNAAEIARRLAHGPLASLARRQILEPREEQRLAAGIPSLGISGNRVSAAVRAQYEANPYPRWFRLPMSGAVPFAEAVRALFPDVAAMRGAPRILVAGCGTGTSAVAFAGQITDCSVLAVDLSLASLAYAKRKTLELGVTKVAYRQGDILALGALPERFHLVDATGVLHHMEEPLAGWRILAGLVEPGGFMRIGLYSDRGRRHYARARQITAALGLGPSLAGIRAARAAIRAAPADELLARVAVNEDFYSASGCRDMLFHVQERCFSLPQIAAMIGELGLHFVGFEFDDGGMTAMDYRARFPADPRMRSLENWHRYEEAHPDAFSRMYEFWLRKPA